MKRAAAKPWCLAILSVIFCAIAVEAMLVRMQPLYPSIFQPDDVLLYRLMPGARKVFTHTPENGGQRILFSVDSDGFRRAEPDSTGRRPRIAVYGDSCIAAEFSVWSNTYPARLQWHIEQAGLSTEVINAGVAGYGPDQAILKMEEDIPAFAPDAVVLTIFADNDFGELLRNRLFRLDDEGRLQRAHPRLNEAQAAQMRSFASPPWCMRNQIGLRVLRAYWRWVRKVKPPTLWTGDYLENSLVRCEMEYRETVIDGVTEVTNLLDDYDDTDISMQPDSPSARYKIRLMEQLIAHAAESLRSKGIPFAVLIVPSPVDVCDNFPHKPDTTRHPQYDRERLSRTVAEIARRQNVRYLNLFDEFRERGADAHYLKGGDDHWNDRGQDLAARLTASWFLDSPP